MSGPIKGPEDLHRHIPNIDQIERITERKNPQSIESKKESLSFFIKVLQTIRKAFDFFISRAYRSRFHAIHHLDTLRSHLVQLQKENKSQDRLFLKTLSESWTKVLTDSKTASYGSVKERLNNLIQSIQNYPEEKKLSLGYYLSNALSLQWVAFPFMELVQKIYNEHQIDPKSSSLTRWIELIDEISSCLKQL